MPPSQRQPSSLSSCQVAGRSSFNIMWHYAQVAERNQRATHIMSAPFRVWARCGLLPHRRAAGRRGCAPQNSAAHRAAPSAVGSRAPSVAPTVWPPSLAAQAPALILGQRQRQQKRGCRPDGLRLTASPRPRPNPAALAAPGSQSLAPCSFPCSPSPPRAAPAGGLPAKSLSCGLRQPAPSRRFTVPQASCGTARAALKPGSLTQRLMAAAAAAAMMRGRQTGTSQHGGSVSGAKSARRGVGVAGV